MHDLEHSEVYRGGVTAYSLSYETESCRFEVNSDERVIDFRFNMDSKGGGVTSVLFQVGFADVATILRSLADETPEEVVLVLPAVSKAAKNLRAELRSSRRQGKQLKRKIEKVESYLRDKYYEAPSGKDQKEHDMYELISGVQAELTELFE